MSDATKLTTAIINQITVYPPGALLLYLIYLSNSVRLLSQKNVKAKSIQIIIQIKNSMYKAVFAVFSVIFRNFFALP